MRTQSRHVPGPGAAGADRHVLPGTGNTGNSSAARTVELSESADRRGSGLSRFARAVTAAGVVIAADVHFVLWYHDGFSEVHAIGPLFLLDAIAGTALGLLVVACENWIPTFLAAGFALATLAGFYLSVTVGIFGLHEVAAGGPQLHAEIAEWTAAVFGLLATFLLRRRVSTADGLSDHLA